MGRIATLNLGISLLLSIATPALASTESSTYSDWYEYYQTIEDQRAHNALDEGIALAEYLFGPPSQDINTVHLRRSEPLHPTHNIKRNFQLTEINHLEDGIFTIYLSQKPNSESFNGQLAHEISHLLNPKIHDAYYEGLCTVFAEKFVEKSGGSWESWHQHFEENKEPFYSQTYFMMKEIAETVGDDALYNFHTYAEQLADNNQKTFINIDDWISTLSKTQKKAVKKIIRKYAPKIQRAMDHSNYKVAFILPSEVRN